MRAAIEDPHVIVLVHGNARAFAEVPTFRKLGPVLHNLHRKLRTGFQLSERGSDCYKEREGNQFHAIENIPLAGKSQTLELIYNRGAAFQGGYARFRAGMLRTLDPYPHFVA